MNTSMIFKSSNDILCTYIVISVHLLCEERNAPAFIVKLTSGSSITVCPDWVNTPTGTSAPYYLTSRLLGYCVFSGLNGRHWDTEKMPSGPGEAGTAHDRQEHADRQQNTGWVKCHKIADRRQYKQPLRSYELILTMTMAAQNTPINLDNLEKVLHNHTDQKKVFLLCQMSCQLSSQAWVDIRLIHIWIKYSGQEYLKLQALIRSLVVSKWLVYIRL